MAARKANLSELATALAELQAQIDQIQKAQADEQQVLEAAQTKLRELTAAADQAEAEAEAKKQQAEFFQSVYGG